MGVLVFTAYQLVNKVLVTIARPIFHKILG